jgi:hypothetical protein
MEGQIALSLTGDGNGQVRVVGEAVDGAIRQGAGEHPVHRFLRHRRREGGVEREQERRLGGARRRAPGLRAHAERQAQSRGGRNPHG